MVQAYLRGPVNGSFDPIQVSPRAGRGIATQLSRTPAPSSTAIINQGETLGLAHGSVFMTDRMRMQESPLSLR